MAKTAFSLFPPLKINIYIYIYTVLNQHLCVYIYLSSALTKKILI